MNSDGLIRRGERSELAEIFVEDLQRELRRVLEEGYAQNTDKHACKYKIVSSVLIFFLVVENIQFIKKILSSSIFFGD